MAKINPNDISTLDVDLDEHEHDFSIIDDGMWYCKVCGCAYDEVG